MSIEQPTFNPHDEKYKKVADLPEKEREKYVDIKSGGFVTKEAKVQEDYAKKIYGPTLAEKAKALIINVDNQDTTTIVRESLYHGNSPELIMKDDLNNRNFKIKLESLGLNENSSLLDGAKTGDPEIFFRFLKRHGISADHFLNEILIFSQNYQKKEEK